MRAFQLEMDRLGSDSCCLDFSIQLRHRRPDLGRKRKEEEQERKGEIALEESWQGLAGEVRAIANQPPSTETSRFSQSRPPEPGSPRQGDAGGDNAINFHFASAKYRKGHFKDF